MPRKIIPNGREYQKRKALLAEHFLVIVNCGNCGSPRNRGYICPFCEEDDGRL